MSEITFRGHITPQIKADLGHFDTHRHQHFFGLLRCQHCAIAGLTMRP
jgi:hypothetical protein